ncbi:dihydrolipoyl dehydrogenase [Lachnospiraceae bacterium ZAX-1]
MQQYDLIVIGGGPGGYVAAIRAAQFGMKTMIVERDKLGGTCLNRGCIPTKALLHAAEAYSGYAHFETLGLSASNVSYDIFKVHARKAEVSKTLRNGVADLVKANGIELLLGTAVLTAENIVSVNDTKYTAKHILIATGSVPVRPPIPGLDLPGVVTSDDILEGPALDYKSLVIIGGGVIGVEMASVYAGFGCKVTIIEALDRLLPTMDKEFGQSIQMLLKKRGVDIFCSARVGKIEQTQDGLCCYFTHKDTQKTAEAFGVLVAIGRRPATEGLFSQVATPDMERGFIKVNERYESSILGLYAVGDVIGGVQLAHKAEAEGAAAVAYMCDKEPETDPRLVPSCIYTSPEISSVGMTADEAKKDGRQFKTAKYLMSGNGKSIIELQERGFVKVVVDAKTDQLLGIQMMCGRATDMIGEFTSAILNGITHRQFLLGMRPHPSFCEGVTEAFEAVNGMSIHSAPVNRT